MAKKITTWSPDTCDCVIDYEWDDTTSEDERTHTWVRSSFKGGCHQGIPDGHGHFEAILLENQGKNKIHGWIAENLPHLTTTDNEGNAALHPDVVFEFSFDKSRVLRIGVKHRITGEDMLKSSEKAQLKLAKHYPKVVFV